MSPTLAAPSVSVPSGGLPAATRSSGGLDAVADGVAHQVQHRIHHPLDEELVDLGVLPAQLEPHALAAVARQIAHDERHAPEDLADRHEPHAHHAFAQIAQLAFDRLARSPARRAIRPAARAARRRDSASSRRARLIDQVADHPHQLVEPGQIDADDVRRRQPARWPRRSAPRPAPRTGRAARSTRLRPRCRPRATPAIVASSSVAGEQELERDAAGGSRGAALDDRARPRAAGRGPRRR